MRRFFLSPIHLHIFFVNLILAWVVVSCAGLPAEPTAKFTSHVIGTPTLSADDTAIPFETLAQGFRLSSPQSTPALLMAVDPEAHVALLPLISPEHQALLTEVDLERNAVLAAIWGIKPSGGFSITIRQIWLTGEDLTVDVILNDDDPTVSRIEAATVPYHFVTIDRLTLPKDANLHYRLVSDDALLAEGELP